MTASLLSGSKRGPQRQQALHSNSHSHSHSHSHSDGPAKRKQKRLPPTGMEEPHADECTSRTNGAAFARIDRHYDDSTATTTTGTATGTATTATRESNDHDTDDEWTEEQHRRFVAAIFDIGLKNASPAVILENMTQKWKASRANGDEFMAQYCRCLERMRSRDPLLSGLLVPGSIPGRGSSYGGSGSNHRAHALLGGDVAGYLTHAVMIDNKNNSAKNQQTATNGTGGQPGIGNNASSNAAIVSTNVLRTGARDYVERYAGSAIQFPILTETEKKSSLGIAMTFIAGLFLTMSQHLTRERARAETIGLKLPSSSTTTSTATATTTSTSSSGVVEYTDAAAAATATATANGE
eukprot:jgi/Psemu1/5217/gm1.5217_g